MNTFPLPARPSSRYAEQLLFFCSSVGPSDGLPSPPSSVLTPKMPSAAPIYDARPRPSASLRLVSAPSVKMRPFQLLLSPPAAERGVGVARAAKQEKIEPVSNRPRARRGAVGRTESQRPLPVADCFGLRNVLPPSSAAAARPCRPVRRLISVVQHSRLVNKVGELSGRVGATGRTTE